MDKNKIVKFFETSSGLLSRLLVKRTKHDSQTGDAHPLGASSGGGNGTSVRRIFSALGMIVGLASPLLAQATLTVTPLTWNIIGLDSNSPATGPKYFPVGARVCSNVATTNVAVGFVWDSSNANINLRAGTLASINIPSLGVGACSDAYFEAEVTQVAGAYNTARRYHIAATDGSGTASTPTPRELYVEHLISQNRNTVTGVKLDGVSIAAGGSMNLLVGNTYSIELNGGTATQGYEQFEAFINFPNTIFQVLSVVTTYSANTSGNVTSPNDKLYADACVWENAPSSPNYRACVGAAGKTGGSSVVTTYTIKILGGGGTSQPLNTLLYDFSGSSFHYNSDFSTGARIATIIDPTTSLTINKGFSPATTVAGGTSTLSVTIGNPTSTAINNANFTDTLPLLSGGQMVVATPASFTTSGCGTPTFTPVAGASSVSFSNGTIAANSSCVITVGVSVPAAPTTGTYVNTTNNLFVGTIDTGHNATANLALTTSVAGTGVCGNTLARWNFPTGMSTSAPVATTANVTATAAASTGITAVFSTSDNTIAPAGTGSWGSNGNVTTGASLVTANDEYFEFALDTTGYSAVYLNFDALFKTPNGPKGLAVYYGISNARPETGTSVFNNAAALTTQSVWNSFGASNSIAFTSGLNPSGTTYFRIYAFNSGNTNSGSDINIDNVLFTGCNAPTQPTLTKSFATNPVAVNGVSTLTFTLTNPNAVQLTGAKFTDALPAGLEVAATPAASTTCTGSPTWAPVAGATSLAFGQTTGAIIPASGSCTVSVDVRATTAGPHTNVSGFISTTESGTNSGTSGSGTASLTAVLPPSMTKQFAANPIQQGTGSLLTFTISNPNTSTTLSGVAFSDTYPAGLTNVNPLTPAVVNTCGGSVTAVAGGSDISLSGGSLTGSASCTVSVTVTAAAAGSYLNTSGAVSATTAGTGNTATDTLGVTAPNPAINLLKQISTSPSGPWVKFLSAAPGTPLYYQFTMENVGDVPFNPVSVVDPLVSTVSCTWPSPLPVASAVQDPTATCVVGPVAALAGDNPNTATAHGTYSGTDYPSAVSTADYIGALPGFSLLKQISASATGPWSSAINVPLAGNVFYKFTLVNTGGLELSSVNVTDPDPLVAPGAALCQFSDPLAVGAATNCVVGPIAASASPGTTTNTATGHGTNGSVIDTAPSSADYTAGAVSTDLSIAKDDGVTSVNAGAATTYTITVTNNGPDEITGGTVVDTAPAGLTIGNWTCAVMNAGTGGTVTTACGAPTGSGDINTTVTMKNGAVITYTVPATVAGNASGSIVNTATVTAPAGVTDPVPGNNSATDTDTVALEADLAITKTNGVASVNAGASTIYTITVTNNGPSSVTGAVLADIAATGLSKTAVACSGTPGQCAAPPSIVQLESGTFALPALASGATYQISVTATVTATSGSVSNTATVTPPAGTTDPTPADNTATDTDTVNPVADLAVTKTDGVSSVNAGGSTSYTITVTNNGPSEVTGATVVDTAPTGLTIGNWTCTVTNPGSGGAATTACGAPSGSGNISTTVTMKNGAIITYTVPATVSGSATGTIVNTATVAPPGGITDPTPGNNSATDSDPVNPVADLAVTKTDGVVSINAGGNVTYTITVTNNGPSEVTGATVVDTAPTGLTLGNWTCTVSNPGSGGTVTTACGTPSGSGNLNTTVTMKNGAVITYTVPATVAGSATGTIVNTATVTPPGGTTDPTPGNNSATDSDTLILQADLAITKTDGVSSVNAGGSTSYTITVTNNGPSEVTGATVVDTAPTGLTIGNWTCTVSNPGSGGTVTTACGAPSGSGNISTTVTMKNGAIITYTVPATVAASATGTIANTATVAPPGGVTDPTPGNNSATDSDPVNPVADLAVTKTDGVTSVNPGGSTSYTITVTNNGPSEVTGATIVDTAPAGLTLGNWTCTVSNPGSGGTVTTACGAASGSGNISTTVTMKNGAVITYTVPATVAANATGNIVNTVTAAPPGGTTDPTPGNNSATDSDTVTAPTSNGAISGSIWFDLNGNHTREINEAGTAGWRVELLVAGNVVGTTTTDATGLYTFSGLEANTYAIRFITPNGVPLSSGPTPVNGETGAPITGGGTPSLCQLTNIVLTADGNGNVSNIIQQSLPIDPSGVVYDSVSRLPIAGATVTLLYNGSPINPAFVAGASATQVTGAGGNYAFFLLPGAPAGTYGLSVTATNYLAPSTLIPATPAPGGYTGGPVTAIAGAPQQGQNTTYYLQFPLPTSDITNNNLPLDPLSTGLREIPSLSVWGLILTSLLLAGLGMRRSRRRGRVE